MIITHSERITQHYQTLLHFQQATQTLNESSERRLLAFASYLSASERQVAYLTALSNRTNRTVDYWSPSRSDTTSELFDPIKAILYFKHIDIYEALWLAFLLIHTGDNEQSGWHYLKQLYGNHNDNHGQSILTWERVSNDMELIGEWIDQSLYQPCAFKFGKHRKYETIKQLYQVVQSYQNWLDKMGGIDGLRDTNNEPMANFAHLYQTMSIYRFGRLAKFEFLSLLGYLNILAIKADHCYLKAASGPKRGAKLLFGSGRRDAQLDDLAVKLADELNVDYAVFEAALCHWQSSPDYVYHPDNLPS